MAGDAFGLIGKVLGGQFRVDELVGEGGFSVVYKGFHMGLKEPVAIKCLRLPQLEKKELADQFAHRFRDESRIAYRLSQGNLNIVRSITSGTTNDAKGTVVPYMVLEWLSGDTLAADFKKRRDQGLRGRSVAEVVQLFGAAAEALSYAHGHGVIHRDVKPQNLFLAQTREGVRLKVLDFGMAKILSDGTLGVAPLAQSMGTNVPVFSPPYAAPEQFDWKVGLIGTWTDVYSLAMVIVEALADKRVRTGESIAECMVQACDPKRKVRPRDLGIPLGDAVDEVLARALSLKPKERQQDMNEFWSAFNAAHKKDAERSQSIPVSFGTDPPPDEVKTAVTDTRSLFKDADLRPGKPAPAAATGAAALNKTMAMGAVKTEPRPFMPSQIGPDPTAFPSDAPTVDVEQPLIARMLEQVPKAPAAPRLDQTLVTAPPVHEGPAPNRTLFGTGPTPKPAPAAGVPATAAAPSPNAAAPRPGAALNRTLGLGVSPVSPAAAAPAPATPMRPPMESDGVTTVTAAVQPPEPAPAMSPDAAAPPVARTGATHDATEVATGAHYPANYPGSSPDLAPQAAMASQMQPPMQQQPQGAPPNAYPQQAGYPPPGYPPPGYAQPGYPPPGYPPDPSQPGYPPPGYPQQQGYPPPGASYPQGPPPYGQQGGYPQTAGYAPLPGSPPGYGPPPASAYGPPPMGAGDGYVNVAPADSKKPGPALIAGLAIAGVLVLGAIGTGIYYATHSRSAPAPASSTIDPATTTDAPKLVPSGATATETASASPPPEPTAIVSATAAPPPEPPPVKTAEPTPPPAPTPPPEPPTTETTPREKPEPREPAEPRPRPNNGGGTTTTTTPRTTPTPTPPPPTPSTKPVDPNAFNADAAKSSLRSMEGILASCKKPDGPTGPGKVKVTFGNAGTVTSAVIVGPPYEGTPVGDCAASRFRMARVSPFEGAPGVVDYAFRINK